MIRTRQTRNLAACRTWEGRGFQKYVEQTGSERHQNSMPAPLVNIDRQTPMFLPCGLREWVPTDRRVHFILDAVEQLPTAHFHVNDRGTGSQHIRPGCCRGCSTPPAALALERSNRRPTATWRCDIFAPITISIMIRFARSSWRTRSRSRPPL